MKKRLWGIVQKIVVSVTVASLVAAYAMPASADGTIIVPGEHTHDGVTFKAWDSDSEFPTGGNWYLTKDITIEKEGDFNKAEKALVQIKDDPLNLCLNGYTVTFKLSHDARYSNNNYTYTIVNYQTFNIYDEKENNGKIIAEAQKNVYGYSEHYKHYFPILISIQADVNVYGGTLTVDFKEPGAGHVFSNRSCNSEGKPKLTLDGGKIENKPINYIPINADSIEFVLKKGSINGDVIVDNFIMTDVSENGNLIHGQVKTYSAKIGEGTISYEYGLSCVFTVSNKEKGIAEIYGNTKILNGKSLAMENTWQGSVRGSYYTDVYIYDKPTIDGTIIIHAAYTPEEATLIPHKPNEPNVKYEGDVLVISPNYDFERDEQGQQIGDYNGMYVVRDVDEDMVGKFTTALKNYVLVYDSENKALRIGKIYNLTLNPNGGNITNPTDYLTYTGWIGKELPIPTKLGSTFEGWYSDEEFSGDPVSEILPSESGDKVFYAKWSEEIVPTYTLTLNLNGGNIDGEETYTEEFTAGDTLSLPEPKREKYTFGGWFSDENFSGAAVKSNDLDTNGDITLWAKWIADPGTVTVTVKSENGAPSISSDESAIKNAVLEDSDQEELAQGKNIKIELIASASNDGSEGEKDQDLGCTIGKCLDISLYKYIDDSEEKLTSISVEIPITLEIPQALQKDGRSFYMIREHGGNREKLPDTDNDPTTVTFKTKLFSPYYIAYSDPEPDPPETTPPVTTPPVTTPPVTDPPVTTPPVTTPPVTTPPVTDPPVTTPPVTTPPVTTPSVTTSPVTTPPVTIPPVTTLPVTEPPVITASPAVTEPPVTTDSYVVPDVTQSTTQKPDIKPAETTTQVSDMKSPVVSGNNGNNTPQKPNQGGNNVNGDGHLNTGDSSYMRFLIITGSVAAYIFTLLYYTTGTYGMTEERKDKLIASVTEWGKKGGRIRQAAAMAIILMILLYYWSIGQKIVPDKAEHTQTI